jgi:hypothetical protein
MSQYTPEEFDRLVKELRPTAPAKHTDRKKSSCTPLMWAAYLNYCAVRYQRNTARIAAYNDRWKSRNKSRCRETARLWRERNKEWFLPYCREYAKSRRKESPESSRESVRLWRQNNPDKNRESARLSGRRRLANNPSAKLASSLRVRLSVAVSGQFKTGSAVRDLGVSMQEFRSKLESQFLPGMTWENRGVGKGKWQIDHIYPLAKADLTDRAQLLAVCNHRNLQPLWFTDNRIKGDCVTPEAQALFSKLVAEFTTQT